MPESDGSAISIKNEGDWQRLADQKLTTVIDPMVFRAGEIFMRGREDRGFGHAASVLSEEKAWNFLDKNILAVGFFFDALILNERLPLFNYGDTFDQRLNFEQRSFAVFNDSDQAVFEPVDVQFQVYQPIKDAMMAKLSSHLSNQKSAVRHKTAEGIISELSDAEYQWDISLHQNLEESLQDDIERQLARFLLGGMIFGEYAERLNSEHWLQPKRAALYVEAAFGDMAPERTDEKALFTWMANKCKLPEFECWQPVFLHHTLETAGELKNIPHIIRKLRRSGAVKDYRHWRMQVIKEWRERGGLSEASLKTVERLKRELSNIGPGVEAYSEAAVSLVGAYAVPSPENVLKTGAKSIPIFEPLMNYVPGRRHIKLLAQSVHARGRYPQISRGVRTFWNSG